MNIQKWIIVIFCTWHMFAIGVYCISWNLEKSAIQIINVAATTIHVCPSIENIESDSINAIQSLAVRAKICASEEGFIGDPYYWLHEELYPIVQPYVLYTSQWQMWNLFSPNPLRRVSTLSFEVQEGDTWKEFDRLGARHVKWWRRTYMLKILRRSIVNDRYEPLRKNFLQHHCKVNGVQDGSVIRMKWLYYVIPMDGNLTSPKWWHEWEPHWYDFVLYSDTCSNPEL